jgi:hypothetical protein
MLRLVSHWVAREQRIPCVSTIDFLSVLYPTLGPLQAVALRWNMLFCSSICTRRVDSQAGFRGKAVSSNNNVSGDVDVR